MNHASKYFAESYQEARDHFLEAVDHRGWWCQSLPLNIEGSQGAELSIDVAGTTRVDSDKLLVVSSGVHGVEGFFGSAVQIAAMEEWLDSASADVNYLFIHAINPYGFASLRRFNEDNVDPNRNFLTGDQEYSGVPEGFADLDSFLNPQRPPSSWEPFYLKSLGKIWSHGMPMLKQAIASGQYEYPQGLFFGGKELSQSGRLLEVRFPEWFEGVDQVVHLDFHTGLGKSGECNLLLENALTRSQEEFLKKQFGEGSYQELATDGVAYDAKGGFGGWCLRKSGVSDYLFACAEFGTYGPISVLSGLRSENQAHHWGDSNSVSTKRAKARLKELFCPASSQWRTQVMARSRGLVLNSIEGLSNRPDLQT